MTGASGESGAGVGESIVREQRELFGSGVTRDVRFRIGQLERLRSMVYENRASIVKALKTDLGRPAFESYLSEISPVLYEIGYVLRRVKSWCRPAKARTPPFLFPASSRVHHEPLGVVLVIAPWNYPVGLVLSPLIGAMAAGNCAVLKPSEVTANCSQLMAGLVGDYFDRDYVAVVEGGAEEAQALLAEDFDYIFYTGGRRVARIVMEAASRTLTPVALELGGKSPCIVAEDADIGPAARRITWGKFFNAGQTCIAPDYLLVQKSIKGALLEGVEKCIRDFYGEDPLTSPDYARIVNAAHLERLLGLLDGEEEVIGGEFDQGQLYLSPTVLPDASLQSKAMGEEVFGPILPVLEYEILDEAIEFVRRMPKPLALYVFSSNRDVQRRLARDTSSGGISINDTMVQYSNFSLPFGGVGRSGFGRYHGRSGFETFSNRRSLVRKSTLLDVYIRYPPYEKTTGLLKKAMRYLT